MGFYWDELPMTWIRYELGPVAMTRYFSTNRPIWGMLYQVTTHILPQVPIYWQVFALLWRWISAVLVWAIARQIWPAARQLAVITAACFLLYPGFTQQWTAFLYSHFFIVLCFLLFSFLCMIWSIEKRHWYWPLTALGMLFAGLNLWMMEYFYTLELVRPFILYGLERADPAIDWRARLGRTLRHWLPYMLVFIANALWRTFVFNNQIYRPSLLGQLKAAPIAASISLLKAIAVDLYTVSVSAWGQVLALPDSASAGPRTLLFAGIVAVAVALLVGLFLATLRDGSGAKHSVGLIAIGLGIIALLAAGGPFWLTGLDVTLAFPANRFTLPFMLGVASHRFGSASAWSGRWAAGPACGLGPS